MRGGRGGGGEEATVGPFTAMSPSMGPIDATSSFEHKELGLTQGGLSLNPTRVKKLTCSSVEGPYWLN